MRLKIDYQERQLNSLFDTVSNIKDNEEIKSHLTRYLCIRTSGYLESVIKSLVEAYVEKSCPQPTQNFINSKVKRVTNLDEKKLTKFLESFSKQWSEYFEIEVSEREKSSLNSVISNRNQIAHGVSVSLNYSNMKQYYDDLKNIVEVLKNIIIKKDYKPKAKK
ncbi:MAG: hypothetical protein EHM58_12780 [Ignavibacteriae bacterium]|nr:MAG: hypothetical protein EHM58_12780 [Ignavibacteriota bacterium]